MINWDRLGTPEWWTDNVVSSLVATAIIASFYKIVNFIKPRRTTVFNAYIKGHIILFLLVAIIVAWYEPSIYGLGYSSLTNPGVVMRIATAIIVAGFFGVLLAMPFILQWSPTPLALFLAIADWIMIMMAWFAAVHQHERWTIVLSVIIVVFELLMFVGLPPALLAAWVMRNRNREGATGAKPVGRP